MCRLYLYTTLKIEEILEVVHRHHNHEPMPGYVTPRLCGWSDSMEFVLIVWFSKDSANKKLSALLDKQPRWLRPLDDQDFYRRCNQLALSPVRTSPRAEWPTSRPHSASAPPPFSYNGSTPIKQERDPHSANLDVPGSAWSYQQEDSPSWSTMMWENAEAGPSNYGNALGYHGRSISADFYTGGQTLSRQSTRMSTSTDQTTGSLDRILNKYPEPYIRLVRKLVKRYTAPIGHRGRSTSPAFDLFARPSWLNDEDAASNFSVRPFPLPGDYLNLDHHARHQQTCFEQSEEHQKRWCMCEALKELTNALWVTPDGPTMLGHRIINCAPSGPEEFGLKDAFGNTLLHFLAARGNIDGLGFYLQQQFVSRVLNHRNSAGQTFLHVLNLQQLYPDALCGMLDFLIMTEYLDGTKFDFSARDHYGRTFFHVLLAADEPRHNLEPILERYRPLLSSSRDAFNIAPSPFDASQDNQPAAGSSTSSDFRLYPDSDNPVIDKEIRLIQTIRYCLQYPRHEDSEGRNGLHCLAAATLSKTSMELKNKSTSRPSPPRRKKKTENPDELLDSSSERLKSRLELVKGLLNSGVDPNHYDSNGNTPLMAFVAQLPEDDDYQTGPQILQLLLQAGANIHARNRAGETAVHIAVRCGRKLSVKALLEHHANVHVRDAAGRSLLTLADVKMETSSEVDPTDYAHYEACRAYLSGGKGNAVQEPTILQEWADTPAPLFHTTS